MKNENITVGQKAVSYILALLIGFAAVFGIMLVLAGIATAADLGESFATPFASLSLAAGGFTSGFVASKRLRRGGLVNGAVCGGVIFAVVLAVSLVADEGGITLNTLFNFIISLLSSVIGGVWGTGKKTKFKV